MRIETKRRLTEKWSEKKTSPKEGSPKDGMLCMSENSSRSEVLSEAESVGM